nr:4.6 kDa protein [Beet necrotic yellow vein virus]
MRRLFNGVTLCTFKLSSHFTTCDDCSLWVVMWTIMVTYL